MRSADFVFTLLRDSRDVNEYAFALGAMAHYAADNLGHRFAVNKSVPILYPKLRQKFGDVVVYDQNPAAHLKTEFGFDVLEVAKGRYAPDDYRDRIGFQVADDLLKGAFEETYCLKLEAIFTNYSLAIGTYRRAIGSIIPKMTKVAWQEKKDEIMKTDPTMTRARFLYHLSHASYRKRWGREYHEPTIGERILAFFIQILPKVGPLRALSFRMPASDTEQLFMASFNNALSLMRSAVVKSCFIFFLPIRVVGLLRRAHPCGCARAPCYWINHISPSTSVRVHPCSDPCRFIIWVLPTSHLFGHSGP